MRILLALTAAALVLAVFGGDVPSTVFASQKVEPEEPIMWPVSIDGAECIPAGVYDWETEYEAPEMFVPPESHRDVMIREISAIWRMYLKDEYVKPEDKRWEKVPIYAAYLADAIIIFQENEVTIRGVTGRLPRHPSTHKILAGMVTLETALRSRVVGKGKLKEVGLIQCHGHALGGYHPQKVRRTPYLGLMLGARWLARAVGDCYPDGFDNSTWETEDWLGPLTVYGAGSGRGKNDDGTCRAFPIAHARVGLARMYGDRIREMNRPQ